MPPISDVDAGGATVVDHRAVEPEDLFHRVGHKRSVVDQPLPLRAVAEQRLEAVADRVACGLVAGEGHRVHDVDDVELVELVGLVDRESCQIAGEVVGRRGHTIGDEVLHVAPHRHDVAGHRNLLGLGHPAVGEQDARAAPRLQLLGVGIREAERAERREAGEREGELLDEIDHRLVTEAEHQVARVGTKHRLQHLQPARRHDGEHRPAHRAVAGRIGVVQGGHPLEAPGQHLLCGGAHRDHGRRGVRRRPRFAVEQDLLDVPVAGDEVVVEGVEVDDGALLAHGPQRLGPTRSRSG